MTRREFVRASILAASGVALGLNAAGSERPAPPRPIIGFSKPFQSMGAAAMASFVEEVGWSGIECPVRAQGQIEPERVGEELPRLVEAFRAKGLDIPIVVTGISSIHEAHAEEVLRVAAKLGIRKFRLGAFKYTADRPLERQLDGFGRDLREIGEACGELGIQAAVQNHSGSDRFGASVWDVVGVLRDARVKNVGICFDIAHATIEGGLSWPIQARLAEPFCMAVYVKDFTWSKGPSGWQPNWCPLGEGMVDRSYFSGLKRSGFSGTLCQHQEYPMGDRADMVAHIRRDLEVLRGWLA
ncbi:MAG: sugar phosphate isomerase/epimerase family protein [Opitutaceae bacterium]